MVHSNCHISRIWASSLAMRGQRTSEPFLLSCTKRCIRDSSSSTSKFTSIHLIRHSVNTRFTKSPGSPAASFINASSVTVQWQTERSCYFGRHSTCSPQPMECSRMGSRMSSRRSEALLGSHLERRKEHMSDDHTLSLSTVKATIQAPIEKVNISDWLLHLPDAEYQRCSHAHIAGGSSTSDDGRPMSINVETIGDALVVQHYVAEIHEPHFCRMVSLSDSISPAGRTKLQVVWELSVKKIDDQTCEYTNHIHSTAIEQTLVFFKEHNVPFQKARDARQHASHAHNQEETPRFAKSIEREALANLL